MILKSGKSEKRWIGEKSRIKNPSPFRGEGGGEGDKNVLFPPSPSSPPLKGGEIKKGNRV
jgi:hypothetical protein